MSEVIPNKAAEDGHAVLRRATALEVRRTTGSFVASFLLALVFLLLCEFAYAKVPGVLLRYAGAVVLGWLGLQVLWSLALESFSGAVVRMDSHGIRHVLLGEVRWQDVGGIAIDRDTGRQGTGPFLSLGLMPGVEAVGAGFVQRVFNRRDSYRFSMRGMDCSPAQILQHATALRDQIQPPRLRAWYPGMAPASLAAALQQEQQAGRMAAAVAGDVAPDEVARRQQALSASTRALERALEEEGAQDRRTLRRWSLAIGLLTFLVAALKLLGVYLHTHG